MKSILLIEDNDFMRMFLIKILGKEFQVYSVKSIHEAFEWLKDANVNLVLSDYPDNQKLVSEFMVFLKFSNEKSIPVFMLTDQNKSEQRIRAFRWGVTDCLSKPFNPLELKIRIQSNLIRL